VGPENMGLQMRDWKMQELEIAGPGTQIMNSTSTPEYNKYPEPHYTWVFGVINVNN